MIEIYEIMTMGIKYQLNFIRKFVFPGLPTVFFSKDAQFQKKLTFFEKKFYQNSIKPRARVFRSDTLWRNTENIVDLPVSKSFQARWLPWKRVDTKIEN